MSRRIATPSGGVLISRRRFVQGLTAAGAAFSVGPGALASSAASPTRTGPAVLAGADFHLTYRPTRVNLTGKERFATAINGSVPAPVLRWREGETVTLKVTNHLAEDTSIHWHGMILPSDQDGVPGVSDGFAGIAPGETFTYRFPVVQNGTYWYHSHSGFQEQAGAYGAIVIDAREPEPFAYEREHVVVLSDWSDEDPDAIYAKLKKMPEYYSWRERTVGESLAGIRDQGWGGFRAERSMWDRMRMSDRDISDVTGATYTFLMNGVPPADGWLGLFRRGERVRLRFVNAAAMTFFDVRIPGLAMTVVAADGQHVEPVTVEEFRIGVAETYDVIVRPADDRAYTLFAQAIDRSGYARGTLTPDPGLTADVPAMDAVYTLGHDDMAMGGEHGGAGSTNMDHGQPVPGGGALDHSQHAPPASPTMDHSQHAPPASPAMDHSQHAAGGAPAPAATDPHAGHRMPGQATPGAMGSGLAGYGSNRPVVHAPSERGPHVDMLAESPRFRLDDPGMGLRNNGRRVLTYAELRNLYPSADPREPGREIDLHLTGNMGRYMWSLNGVRFADSPPLRLAHGERVRINLVNDTMMNHPMHLHGMWSELETGDAERIPRKHTVIVPPGGMVSQLVTADALGAWAYHCHLLYHMPGMFRIVVVS